MKIFKKIILLTGLLLFLLSGIVLSKTRTECFKSLGEIGDRTFEEYKKLQNECENLEDPSDCESGEEYYDFNLEQCAPLDAKINDKEEEKKECAKNNQVWDSIKGCIGGTEGENIIEQRKKACEAIGEKFYNGSCSGALDESTLRLTVNPKTGKNYTDGEVKVIVSKNTNPTSGGSYSGSGNKSNVDITAPSLADYCSKRKHDSGGLLDYDGGVCEKIDGKYISKKAGDEKSGYVALIDTANKVIKWIVSIASLIAAAMAFYGGWLYISGSTNPAARTKANTLFLNLAIGLFLVFAAWFIVQFILNTFATGQSGTNKGSGEFSGIVK